MKNRPITARVKSGMFKTREPLLNVGPAGVDGNNNTRTMPSPSKMKGYAMKSSPFKQVNQPRVTTNADGTVKVTLDTRETKPGEAGSNSSTSYNSRSIKDAPGGDQATDLKKYMEGLYKRFGDDVTTDELIKRKFIGEEGRTAYDGVTGGKNKGVATVTPGTDGTSDVNKDYEQSGDPMRKVIGEASTAYESRNNLRKGVQANRKVKKYEIKNARSKKKGGGYYRNVLDDKFKATGEREFVTDVANDSSREIKKEGRIAKRDQAKKDRAARKSDPTLSAKEQRKARNKKMKSVRAEAKETKRDSKKDFKQEKSEAKAKQNERNYQIARQEAAGALEQSTQRKTGFSQNKKIRTTDVGKTLADGYSDKQVAETGTKELVKTTENDVTATGKMKSSGFFKKKSPMKMNYFKK